jgi:uncharacterized protein (DUF1697 family)
MPAGIGVVISMLRGVNVGGHHKIRMSDLKALYKSLGLRNVQTYINSGNVIFKTAGRDPERLRKKIEDAIESRHGFRPAVILRTPAELREAIARNPFASRPGFEPGKLAVCFLAGDPSREAVEKVLAIEAEPEELRIDGSELYIYFPNGMARPKLSMPLVERTLKTPGTSRNWNTVRKLLEMAERPETHSSV